MLVHDVMLLCVSCRSLLVCMTALLVSSPQGLAARRSLLRYATLFDYSAPVRCDLKSPVARLAQLLEMDPESYTRVAGAELPAPVWDDNKFIAGRLSNPCHLKFWQ